MIWRKALCGLCVTAICALTMAAQADERTGIEAVRKAGGVVRTLGQNVKEKEVELHLTKKDVTDDLLVHVAAISDVAWLNLRGTKITDAGLGNIGKMKTLTRLHLELTGISDAGLAHLTGLQNLEYLNLYGTQVSDAGLANLKGLKKLKKVYLWQSKATPAGAEALAKAMPELEVNIGVEPVTATSAQSFYAPRYDSDRAIDGNANPTHSWVSQQYGGGTAQNPQDTWWAITFGNVVKIKGVKIVGDGRAIIPLLKNFQIQAGNGTNWQTIQEVKDASTKTTTSQFDEVLETKSIRIFVSAKDLPSDGMVRICELLPIAPDGTEITIRKLELNKM